MNKILDTLTPILVVFAMLMSGVGTYAFLNVITRPEMITVSIELPQRKGIVTVYDAIDNEVGLGVPPEWYVEPVDYEANIRYNDSHLRMENIFVNHRSYTVEEHICLAKNIYFEARNESLKGQIAIALVTLNRLQATRWSNEACDVIYAHEQFSWYSDGLSDRPRNNNSYLSIALIASAMLDADTAMYDFTLGSTHYHADYVAPYWIKSMVRKAKVDTHIFYYEPVPVVHTIAGL